MWNVPNAIYQLENLWSAVSGLPMIVVTLFLVSSERECSSVLMSCAEQDNLR